MDPQMKTFLYNVGMFGTCANPLHLGHVSTIIKAACECRELYIVLSYSKKRNEIDFRMRHRWLAQTVQHLPHVQIIDLEDDAPDKESYSETHWQQGAEEIKQRIGKPIDAIYCGSDYCSDIPSPYQKHYPNAKIIYTDRALIPISSTAIRQNPQRNWNYIAKAARPFFVKTVLIIGHESTGKSTLTQNLAALYNTEFVSEYGRDVCAECGGTDFMLRADYEKIIITHRIRIHEARNKANRYLFIDTDALTTFWYAQMDEIDLPRPTRDHFDLILFLDANVPFIQDGLRSEENNAGSARLAASDTLKQFYLAAGYSFRTINGTTHAERLAQAIQYIEEEGIEENQIALSGSVRQDKKLR